MNEKDINRIEQLSDKIQNNTANLNDYEEYEKLLIQGGYSKKIILKTLKDANIETYKELIEKRNKIYAEIKQSKIEALERRKIVEGIAVVGLIALGLAVLFNLFRKDN